MQGLRRAADFKRSGDVSAQVSQTILISYEDDRMKSINPPNSQIIQDVTWPCYIMRSPDLG